MKETKRDEAIHFVSAVGMMDTQSAAWVADTVATMRPLLNSIGMELKLIPDGTFTMGQAGGGTDETPHKVTLTKPFYIGVYEVTNAQWKAVMGSLPNKDDDDGDSHPACYVGPTDAELFCRKLSALPEERAARRSRTTTRGPTNAAECRRTQLGKGNKILGGFLICTEMYGSGAVIVLASTPAKR